LRAVPATGCHDFVAGNQNSPRFSNISLGLMQIGDGRSPQRNRKSPRFLPKIVTKL
jgi:hypothetical protein